MSCLPIAKLQAARLRVKSAVTRRGHRQSKRRSLIISDPYDFQHIMKGSPHNMNEDEKESVRDTDLLIRRRMNILLRKTAATRMIPIEDQQQQYQPRPASSSTNSLFHNPSQTTTTKTAFGGQSSSVSIASTATGHHQQQRPKTPMKTRAGYRGLASSSCASAATGGRGLAYCVVPSETRPSVTQSFAALDDAAAPGMSRSTSFVTLSEGPVSPQRNELRGRSI